MDSRRPEKIRGRPVDCDNSWHRDLVVGMYIHSRPVADDPFRTLIESFS